MTALLFLLSLALANDADADGFDASVDCDDQNEDINPAAPELCDEIDNNCNDLIDEGLVRTYWPDLDGDGFGDPLSPIQSCEELEGYINNNQDCDDSNAEINPFAEELCDEIDNNCNYGIDEGCFEEPEDTAQTSEPSTPEDTGEPDDTQDPADTAAPTDTASADTAETQDSAEDTEQEYKSGPLKDTSGCAAFPLFVLLLLLRKEQ